MKSIIQSKNKKIKQISDEKKGSFWTSNIIFFILIIIFSSSLSFFLGKISSHEFEKKLKETEPTIIKKEQEKQSQVVVSKKGAVYHLPWCSGALRLKEGNKIYFKNKDFAEKAGYRPAKNCEGL